MFVKDVQISFASLSDFKRIAPISKSTPIILPSIVCENSSDFEVLPFQNLAELNSICVIAFDFKRKKIG